ncbi:peritrophin-48 [Drosophila obscura]|uniref:peritrophin-48 n=1 Tax=Drosophila obscura TaxID=7282 RepID=UPI001BB14530|nr:peritrophin-48 [Drosophila obscura]
MTATGKFFSAAILCLVVSSALGDEVSEGNYNVTAFCTVVQTGTNLASIVDCSTYYTCRSTGPVKNTCSSGYAFSVSTGTCTPVGQANCYYGVQNPCEGKTGESWVPVTGTCNQYYYCLDGVNKGQGSCKGTQEFDKLSQQCVYGNCNPGLVDTSGEPNLQSVCEVVPPGQYFGDTKNCQKWNYCQADGTLQTNDCATEAFDVQTRTCGYDTGNVCSRVTENDLGTASTVCTIKGEFQANANICGSYQICNGNSWVSNDCSYGYYYDTRSKSCQPRRTATPVEGCNRCQFATTTWVNAVNSTTCASYYYCNNGKATLQTCKEDFYFNESQQACLSTSNGFDQYVSNNGACYGATIDGGSTDEPADGTTDKPADTPDETTADDADGK